MECNCGGSTKDHEVLEKGEVVIKYVKCSSCGRVLITWEKEEDF